MLQSLQETIKKIESGRQLVIAGDEGLLTKLPKGQWIGGTIPYFMTEDGGKVTKEYLHVNDLTDIAQNVVIKSYELEDLSKINEDSPEQGFTILIIPYSSAANIAYAQDAPSYPGFFMKPILGWISGVHLDDLGKVAPRVFNGMIESNSDQRAVAIHCTIDSSKNAIVNIVNLFTQGNGDTIKFDEEGFSVRNCIVNGQKRDFAEYIKENNLDTRLPLVADYCGAMVNVSYQGVTDGAVSLYAPVFKDVEYKFAAPIVNYVEDFKKVLPKDVSPVFTCNCILNFLYSELEGQVVEKMSGPITFGEIAYQLLNQTLVYLEVK